MEGYSIDRMYMSQEELDVLNKLYICAERDLVCHLTSKEMQVLKSMVKTYTKPNHSKK